MIGVSFLILLALACDNNPAQHENWKYDATINQYFEDAGVTGVFLAYNSRTNLFLTNDMKRSRTAFIPASTFKIFNSLVALELEVLANEEVKMAWDGKDRGRSKWNQDHNMRSAIKYSTVWFYQEVAKRIGVQHMQHYVDLVGYGNRDISGGMDLFWLEGGLRISPYQQINFLHRLYRNDLPFSQRNMDIVKDIIVYEKTETYTLRAKTGLGSHFSPQVGWFVGYVDSST